jgi:hypothetical protein
MFLQFCFVFSDAEPHHFHADPDPVLHFFADPDPSFHNAHFSISHNQKKQFRVRNLIVFVRFYTLKCRVNYITYRSYPDPRALRAYPDPAEMLIHANPDPPTVCSMNKVLYVVLSLSLLHFSAGMVDVILK